MTHVLSNVEHSGELTDLQLNKKASEIIGDSHNSFTEKEAIYLNGYITEELIRKHINDKLKYYYLCGPQKMMESVENHLSNIGINEEFIVKEEF